MKSYNFFLRPEMVSMIIKLVFLQTECPQSVPASPGTFPTTVHLPHDPRVSIWWCCRALSIGYTLISAKSLGFQLFWIVIRGCLGKLRHFTDILSVGTRVLTSKNIYGKFFFKIDWKGPLKRAGKILDNTSWSPYRVGQNASFYVLSVWGFWFPQPFFKVAVWGFWFPDPF